MRRILVASIVLFTQLSQAFWGGGGRCGTFCMGQQGVWGQPSVYPGAYYGQWSPPPFASFYGNPFGYSAWPMMTAWNTPAPVGFPHRAITSDEPEVHK